MSDPDPTLPADSLSETSVGLPVTTEVDLGERYDLGPILGKGGMGEVRLARDVRIDREVAVKLMHAGARDELSIARFFREARVQGALEHPAVVPVHDLGIDREGNPYFVMKKLAGASMYDVLAKGGVGKRTLLDAVVAVCMAIDLAHTRGVVHRDLKPANIMLGDFGEVYVLDWGLARIIGDTELQDLKSVSGTSGPHQHDSQNRTVVGALLGTPGYMSPEQARGEEVGRETDIFALGCVLYEVLCGVPALPRGMEAIEKTLSMKEHRPSVRVGVEVAPELDDLCARATAADAIDRPTARQLADGIKAYLDGDRDAARRKELAEELARHALLTLEAATDADGRAAAMREAGRAIALDAGNAIAARVLARVMLAAPDTIPPAALAAADAERGAILKRLLVNAGIGFVVMLVLVPTLFAFTVRVFWPVAVLVGGLFAITCACFLAGRGVLPMTTRWFYVVMGLMTVVLATFGIIFGPLLMLPVFITGSISAWLVVPVRHSSAWVIMFHACAIVPLLVLEHVGVLPSTFTFEAHRIVFEPWVIDLSPAMAIAMYAISLGTQVANQWNIMVAFKKTVEDAQDRRHAQSWHLEQLLPSSSPAPSPKNL